MTDFERNKKEDEQDGNFSKDIHSKVVRAGKRTYFFDVKSTKNNEMYLIITERKKIFENEGNFFYEKHKIFLYKEDFENFEETLKEMFDFISKNQPETAPGENFSDKADFAGLD